MTPAAIDLPFPATSHAFEPRAFDNLLRALVRERVDDLGPSSWGQARIGVRRRVAELRRRRYRLRRAVGGGSLVAGMSAGSVQAWVMDRTSTPSAPSAEPSIAPAAEVTSPTAPAAATSATERGATAGPAGSSPVAPTAGAATSWTRDPATGLDREAADPGALHADGRFHVFTTSAVHCTAAGCRTYRVPRFSAADLARPGRLEGDAMPDRPAWVDPGDDAVWAPAAAQVEGRYVLWFAATSGRPGDGGMKCLGAAVADRADGRFVPEPAPLHCAPGFWAIDPYPVAHDGGWSLLWRQDTAGQVNGTIVSAPLRPDGLGLAGPSWTLLVGEHAWEEGHAGLPGIGPIENPALARHPATGEWLLTWSANLWETRSYATGLAVCAAPTGPCRRVSDTEPWLRTSTDPGFVTIAEVGGAGGLSFVAGPDRSLYAVLHGYGGPGPEATGPRLAWAFRVEATAHGAYRLVDIAGNRTAATSVIGT